MTDWVFEARTKRIRDGERKHGEWHTWTFRKSHRNAIKETIEELLDAINYLEMAYALRQITAGEFKYYESILTNLAESLERKLT